MSLVDQRAMREMNAFEYNFEAKLQGGVVIHHQLGLDGWVGREHKDV